MNKRISSLDIGTNTALLLIADLEPSSGSVMPIFHKQTIVRLGKDVDAEKRIDSAAIQRLVDCMVEYRQLSDEHGSEAILAVGTSALRDAKNRDEVIASVARAAGITIACISGHEEAELTFCGAVAGMNDFTERFTVIDIGGGSTEISMGSLDAVAERLSLDIGSVRLTERFFSTLPPSDEEFERAKMYITMLFTSKIIPFFAGRERVYGVAGTLTTIAQVTQGLQHFDALKVHNYALQYHDVRAFLERLKTSNLDEIIALGIPDGRADVITMGTLILYQFMRLLGVGEIHVSIQGLRFGIAQKELLRLQGNI